MLNRRYLPLFLVVATALGACALPRGGPIQSEITKQTAENTGEFSVVAISRANVEPLRAWQSPSVSSTHGWPSSAKGGMTNRIRAGDRISVTIWENEANALLTPATQKSVNLPDIVVSPSGTIFLPYIGDYLINNQTPEAARAALQDKISGILASPQVQLSVNPGRQNTVDLVAGVAKPGSYPLPDQNFSVLSFLSLGGGIPAGLRNPQLRLMRGDKIYGISSARLMADPRRDAVLRGGDKLIVEEDKRYFLALGASNKQSQVFFPQDRLTALDAMALAGGVAQSHGNPEAILILRNYPASALRHDGTGPDNTRMIFTLDLTSADGLFSAQNFDIAAHDLVLVSESPVNGLRTLIGMFGQSASVVRVVSND